MKLTDMTIEEMCTTTEKQSFDRKSAKIEATAIATPMIAFANADGGLLAVGIEDNGEITGIDDYAKNKIFSVILTISNNIRTFYRVLL